MDLTVYDSLGRPRAAASVANTPTSYPWFGKPYVASGIAVASTSALVVNYTAGETMINGGYASVLAGSVTLTASSTNYVWLIGSSTGATPYYSATTSTTVPANSVLAAVHVTGASTVTSSSLSYRGVIAPGRTFGSATTGSGSLTWPSAVTTVGSTLTLVHDGVTPVSFRVSWPRTYVSTAADMYFWLYNMTTNAAYGYARQYSAGATQLQNVFFEPSAFAQPVPAFLGTNLWNTRISGGNGTSTFNYENIYLVAYFDF